MIPRISNYAYKTVAIPQITGGINTNKDSTLIDDNQLANGVNVWQQDGVLQTRFGKNILHKFDANEYSPGSNNKIFDISAIAFGKEKVFLVISGREFVCIKKVEGQNVNTERVEMIDSIPTLTAETTVNCVVKDGIVYLFFSYFEVNQPSVFKIYIGDSGYRCEKMSVLNGIYIPTVATNIGPVISREYGLWDSWSSVLSRSGVLNEGFNLINPYYKVKYSTVLQYETGTGTEDVMRYRLPFPVAQNSEVRVAITDKYETSYFLAKIEGDTTTINKFTGYWGNRYTDETFTEIKDSNIKILVQAELGLVTFMEKDGNTGNYGERTESRSQYLQNNLEITACHTLEPTDYNKVLKSTFNEWYGGGSSGIYGGVHLFMGGNSEYKNLVVYSDINKPLYFGENNYFNVGSSNTSVTAFGKQGESLIIFKENEIYSANYNSLNVSDDGVIVDVAASDVAFNLAQVHGYIGCDCPSSVQLCRNRLVWTNSNGEVYSLVSANQYNERSIYKLSENIEKQLKEMPSTSIRNCVTADFNGHYVLFVRNKAFLMDYNSYGFTNAYSYSKLEGAQNNIPWWIWEFPTNYDEVTSAVECVAINGQSLIFIENSGHNNMHNFFISEISNEYDKDEVCVYDEQINEDKHIEKTITSMVQTKTFDFGVPTLKKNVAKIEFVLGNNNGAPIYISTLTEEGTDENEIRLVEENIEGGALGHFQTEIIKPINKINYHIALKLETEGKLEVGSLILHYKRLGGKN